MYTGCGQMATDAIDVIQRDLGRLEGTVDAQGERLDQLAAEMSSHNKTTTEKLDRILAFQEQQKGAGRVVILLGAAFGAVAGLVVSIFKS
jgi:hypothetical protein